MDIQTSGKDKKSNTGTLSEYLDGTKTLTVEELSRADSLVWELRDEWMYRWHRTWERGLVSEILLFARSIKQLGENKRVNLLIIFGLELEAAAMDFDISLFNSYLQSYPDLIRILGGTNGSS